MPFFVHTCLIGFFFDRLFSLRNLTVSVKSTTMAIIINTVNTLNKHYCNRYVTTLTAITRTVGLAAMAIVTVTILQ